MIEQYLSPLTPAADSLYSPDSQAAAVGAHSCYTRFAATLDGLPLGDGSSGGVAAFDAAAFRIPAAEAALLDPHTRHLLQHAAAALADGRGRAAARSPPISGSTGVFVGCMWGTGTLRSKYMWLLKRAAGCLLHLPPPIPRTVAQLLVQAVCLQ